MAQPFPKAVGLGCLILPDSWEGSGFSAPSLIFLSFRTRSPLIRVTRYRSSPINRRSLHRINTNSISTPAANSAVRASSDSRESSPTSAFSSSPTVPLPMLQPTLTITTRPSSAGATASPETPASPPYAAGPRTLKCPAKKGARAETIGTLKYCCRA